MNNYMSIKSIKMEEMDRFLEKFNYSRLYPQYPNLVKIETHTWPKKMKRL